MIKAEDIKNPYHPQSNAAYAFESLKNLYKSFYAKADIVAIAKDYDRNLASNLVLDVESWYK